ncbi:MAG: flagellin [Terracidiphilus sp.]
MGYSSGTSVFVDLTKTAGTNANVGDSLVGTGGVTTIAVSYEPASGGAAQTATITAGTGSAYGDTVQGLMSAINNSGLGITASFGTAAEAGAATGGSVNAQTDTGIIISGPVSVGTTASALHPVEVTEGADPVEDTQTAQAAGPTFANGSAGTAIISYTDSGGQALSGTDLSNQADSEAALTDLNTAITDVAAQDGYLGAQINTLNAVSQVISTQQENVQSAQNAVQATDYASASSNMSKYEILSQTGISALAQANSVQQEVTKLLQ